MPIIEFEGLAENLIPGVKAATDAIVQMRSEVNKTNEDIKKGAQASIAAEQQLGETIEATAQALQSSSKSAADQAASVEKSRQAAAKLISETKGLTDAQRQQAAAAGGVTKEYNAIAAAAKKSNDAAKVGFKEQIGLLSQLQSRIDLLNQRKLSLLDPKQIARTNAELKKVTAEYNKLANAAPQKNGIEGLFQRLGGANSGLIGTLTSGLSSAGGGVGALGSLFTGLTGPIGIVSGLVIGLVSNLTRLDSVKVFVDGLGIAFDGLLDRMTNLQGIGSLISGTGLQAEAIAAERLAVQYDRIEDKQNAVNLANAEANLLLAEKEQKLRDVTRTEEDRLAIAKDIAAIETRRAAAEIDLLNDRIQTQIDVNRKQIGGLKEVSDENKKHLADLQAQLKDAQASSVRLLETAQRRENGIREQGATERDRLLQEELQRRQKANEDLARLEEDLARRSANADQQLGNPEERLDAQQRVAEAEVQILEDKLRAANAALGRGNELTEKQEQQLANARLGILIQFDKDRQALELKSARDRLVLIEDSGERERAAFDIALKEQIRVLEDAGATQLEIARFIEERQSNFRQEQVEKAIAQEEELALARIDAIQKGAETEEQYRLRIELLKLQTQEDFANQRLEQIKDSTKEEDILLRAQLEGIINEINRKQEELAQNAPKLDLFQMLGINLTEDQKQRFIADLQTLASAVQETVLSNIASQQAGVQAQIDATDQIIEDQQRRREELQDLLDQALEEDEAGRANNSDAIRAQIEETKRVEAEALEEKKRQLAEQQRLARQQILIDAASQASAIALSVANLIKTWSTVPFGIGLVSAFAQAATIIATFSSIRAKIKASAAEVPQFREGGELDGPSHLHGGIALIDRRSGKHFAEAEGGEFIVKRKAYERFPDLIRSINEGSLPKIQRAAMAELLSSANIRLDTDKVTEIIRTKEVVNSISVVQNSDANRELRKEIRELKEVVETFKSQEKTRPSTSSEGPRTVTRTPNRVVIKR